MADQQIEGLTQITSLASGDMFIVNDVSDTTDDGGGSPKRIDASDVKLFMSGLTLDSEYNAGSGNTSKTLVVGKMTPIDLGANNGGNLNANVTITLPSASAGDVCGFFITRASTVAGSFPGAPGYCAELANATRVNDAAYTALSTGSGKWGLWNTGEYLVFRYLDTGYGSGTSGWYVESDGRKPMRIWVYKTADQTTTNGAWTKVALDTTVYDNGMLDTSNNGIKLKRTNRWMTSAYAYPKSSPAPIVSGTYIYDGTDTYASVVQPGAATNNVYPKVSDLGISFAVNTLITVYSYNDVASGSPVIWGGKSTIFLKVTEELTL